MPRAQSLKNMYMNLSYKYLESYRPNITEVGTVKIQIQSLISLLTLAKT